MAEHVPLLAQRRGLYAALLLAALSVMPVEWQAPAVYEPKRAEVELRMAPVALWPQWLFNPFEGTDGVRRVLGVKQCGRCRPGGGR